MVMVKGCGNSHERWGGGLYTSQHILGTPKMEPQVFGNTEYGPADFGPPSEEHGDCAPEATSATWTNPKP